MLLTDAETLPDVAVLPRLCVCDELFDTFQRRRVPGGRCCRSLRAVIRLSAVYLVTTWRLFSWLHLCLTAVVRC